MPGVWFTNILNTMTVYLNGVVVLATVEPRSNVMWRRYAYIWRKGVSVHTTKSYGGVDVWLHSLYISTISRESSATCPCHFTVGVRVRIRVTSRLADSQLDCIGVEPHLGSRPDSSCFSLTVWSYSLGDGGGYDHCPESQSLSVSLLTSYIFTHTHTHIYLTVHMSLDSKLMQIPWMYMASVSPGFARQIMPQLTCAFTE